MARKDNDWDYKCSKCVFKFDIIHHSNDVSIEYCPHCGGELK